MAELVETYSSLPLGTSDASVIALAERLAINEVATLDHRHFAVARPRHTASLTLLPLLIGIGHTWVRKVSMSDVG